ncbi:hypothetical protein [Streptomyces albidoflavus]|uniref:hypothetical protein n=1 Tax=Streptomyces albidoflavus TaxID=1886 RepID=UPI0033AA04FE
MAFLAVALVTGCSSAGEPDVVIVPETAPPVQDEGESRKRAEEFRESMSGAPGMRDLAGEVTGVYGDWEGDGHRAFIVTGLKGAEATKRNGERIAEAFAAWDESDEGRSKVAVYDGEGDLLSDRDF